DGKKTDTVKLTLGAMSEEVPDQLQEAATAKKALEPRKSARPMPAGKPDEKKEEKKKEEKKKPEVGLLKRTTVARDHEYMLYVPEDYDTNIAYALVVWLHPAGKKKDKETENVIADWEEFCSENHILILAPKAESDSGWLASEADFVTQTIRDVMGEYTID